MPLVHDLILERLAQLHEEGLDLGRAEDLYRVVHRMEYYRVGPPAYPSAFTWGELEAFLGSTQAWAEPDNGPLEEA